MVRHDNRFEDGKRERKIIHRHGDTGHQIPYEEDGFPYLSSAYLGYRTSIEL